MSKITRFLFAIITALIVIWMSAGDLISKYTFAQPHNTIRMTSTGDSIHLKFMQKTTLPALVIWAAVLIIGFSLKRWGKKQLGLGMVVAFPAMLPMGLVLSIGGASVRRISESSIGIGLVGLLVIGIILAAKLVIWKYWWQLVYCPKLEKSRGYK